MNKILKKFLKTGNLGSIYLGNSLEETIPKLGITKEISEPDSETVIYKYNGLQVTFKGNILVSIALNFLLDKIFPDALLNEDINITKDLSLYNFIDLLDENLISWEIDQGLSFDRQISIKTSAEVLVIFDIDNRELQSMFLVSPRRS